jgi:Matrixin
MRRLIVVPVLGFLLASVWLMPSTISAHFDNCDAVDGRGITWISSTLFASDRDYAISQWNALGGVNIVPNPPNAVADLWFRDVNRVDLRWTGAFTCRPFGNVDYIKFNRFFFNGLMDAQQKNVAMHELGHALGLGHSFAGQIMEPAVTFVITPQSHDIADYCGLWALPGLPGCLAAGGPGRSGGGGAGDGVVRRLNSYVADFSDPRRLVGAVDNVFVGRVADEHGTTILDDEPETQFVVEVLENIKGSLDRKVIVNQEGGVHGDEVVVVEGDTPLRAGEVYLFATAVYEAKGWHTLVPGYGDIHIVDEKQHSEIVEKFKQATQEQVKVVFGGCC